MPHLSKARTVFVVPLACCLAFLFAACALQPGLYAAQVVSANSNNVQQTLAMPQTQTTCPAPGTARAAIMRPLALGSHPNIVYVYNNVPPNTSTAFGILKRYDITTGQKTVLVTNGIAIQDAQLSADGQWVLFLTTPDPRGDSQHSALMQLIRLDGKGLQTLYCPAASVQITSLQWSNDEKSIIFDTFDSKTQQTAITLLDVNSGKLHTELVGARGQQTFNTVTWLDNKRVYVLSPAQNAPEFILYILDITKNRDVHGGDLLKVTNLVGLLTSWSLDSSFNATKLFLGECQTPENSRGSLSNIFVEPATGGTQTQLYHDPARCLNTLRAVTKSTLLFVDQAPGGDFGIQELWKVKTDGSGLTRLFDNGGAHTNVELNTSTQFPWSNVSRDSSMYALSVHGVMSSNANLLVGSLNGGAPKTFASTTQGTLFIAGWTTM